MADANDERKRESQELADRGFACLREGDYETAIEIAQQLEQFRYTAAFDIAAQAYAGLDDLRQAVETLERGVRKAPDCWLNWQLLGNYRSDLEDPDGAADAYQRALTCPDVWEDSIRLNQAILASRRGDHEGALRQLDLVTSPELALQVAGSRITALRNLGRDEEALSQADACLCQKWDSEDASESLAYIAATLGRIRLASGCPSNDVRRQIMDAIRRFGTSNHLLALIRDIDGFYSPNAQYFRLLIHGSIPEDHPLHHEASGFFITYDVVAESPEQALRWIQELERVDDISVSLQIEESTALELRPEDPMGVYRQAGRSYYQENDDE